jgi:hypothetical protein
VSTSGQAVSGLKIGLREIARALAKARIFPKRNKPRGMDRGRNPCGKIVLAASRFEPSP